MKHWGTMDKRILALFSVFVLLCGIVMERILTIDAHMDYTQAARNHSSYTLTLARTRGKIYDRNGNPLVGGTSVYKAVVIPSAETSAALSRCLAPEEFTAVSDSLKGTFPFALDVPDGSCESEGITVYRVPQRYTGSRTAVHLVGYCGQNGGESGIEAAYDDILANAAGELTVTCRVNAAGKSLAGARQQTEDTTFLSDRGVMLTIDFFVQNIAESAAAAHLERGAVVILDAETSEVRAMVSLPTYDREAIADVLHDERAPLVNRAIAAYNAGSVFKPVIAAAALEHGLNPEEPYECEGAVSVGSLTMGCIHHTPHGTVTLREAIALSCNTYFIHTAQETGAQPLLEMAQALGFGQFTPLSTRYTDAGGSLPSSDELTRPAALANFSFGQGSLTVTPVQVAGMMAAIARGGIYIPPTVVRGLTDEQRQLVTPEPSPPSCRVMRQSTAAYLGECLRASVTDGTAKAGATQTVTSAAKTGTAETGILRGGRAINQAWYAGYFPYEAPRYICVVLAEGGASGGGSAGPVFKEIAERITRAGF